MFERDGFCTKLLETGHLSMVMASITCDTHPVDVLYRQARTFEVVIRCQQIWNKQF
jgi:hypothetical protein